MGRFQPAVHAGRGYDSSLQFMLGVDTSFTRWQPRGATNRGRKRADTNASPVLLSGMRARFRQKVIYHLDDFTEFTCYVQVPVAGAPRLGFSSTREHWANACVLTMVQTLVCLLVAPKPPVSHPAPWPWTGVPVFEGATHDWASGGTLSYTPR